MRLLELQLLAFGAFEGQVLDFSAHGPRLHVVYGPNEAGKSTALRAITGLLYGIPERTGDAFLHKNQELRIGGRIEHRGETLSLVRRKGRKKTLLDLDGQPIDEAPLLRALGGVSEEIFLTMFGLDHRTLRRGAEALLRGEGGLGESLFDAGGAQGIGEVLAELQQEAEGLYKPRGQNQPLAVALRAYAEAREAIDQRDVQPKAWVAQREAVEATEAELEELNAERRRLDAERRRLDRALRVLPILAEHQELRTRLDALGDAPRLPEDATEKRQRATKARDEAARDEERVSREIGSLEQQREAVELDEAALALAATSVERIDEMLRRYLTALEQRPKEVAERREREELALERLREVRKTVTLEEVDALRIDNKTEVRVGALAEEYAGRREALDGARRRHRDAEAQMARARSSFEALPSPRDGAVLEQALDRARRAGDLDAGVGKAGARLRAAERALEQAVEALPRFSGTAGEAIALSLPNKAEVRQAASEARERADRRGQLEEQRRRVEARYDEVRHELDTLTSRGDLPTESDLDQARKRRDRLGNELRRAVKKGKGAAELDAFFEAVTGADHVSDRLRLEADRVARWARLESELTAQERDRDRLADELAELAELADQAAAQWRELWPGVDVGEPEAMIEWLDEHRTLRERAAEVTAAEEALEAAESERAAVRAGLSEALKALAEPVTDGDDLGPLLDRAQALSGHLREEAATRSSLAERMAEREEALATLARELEEQEAAMATWRKAWSKAMKSLSLSGEARIDEAREVLSALREGFDHLAHAKSSTRRLEGMDRDAADFEAALRPLVDEAAPDLGDQPLERAASDLLERHAMARRAQDKREELTETIAAKREELAAIRRRAAEAEAELQHLAKAAGVASADELEAAEERAEQRRSLEGRLQSCEDKLFAEGQSIDGLRAQVEGVDVDEARVRVEDLAKEHEDLIDRLRDLEGDLATKKAGLDRLREREGAHGAAADRQAVVAEIARIAERWATLRLASVVLEREIERYREQNEGPVIRRASSIFPKLTLGEYSGLKSSYDDRDQAELRCLGVDGAEVPIEGLSDGARDQLYLALRIASLERYAEQAELMPFVADDILVHFDEDRARAALSVLSDFAATTQVLMFTHQARHVELAREAVGEDRLVVHELAGGRRRAKAG